MCNQLDHIAMPVLDEIKSEARGVWNNPDDIYYDYRHLQNDKRGSFGERFFEIALTAAFPRRITVEYKDGDQGEWDLKINNYKFEIKTSSIGVNGKFQNEGLHDDADYYGVLFLCVTPNRLYYKFVKKEAIPFARLHNRRRRGTGSGFKWDFTMDDVMTFDTIRNFGDYFNHVFPEVFHN